GALCVVDHKPRALDARQQTVLAALAQQVMSVLELRRLERDAARATEQLRAERNRLDAVFETMAEGVVIQDRDGVILSATARAAETLGLTLEQLRGHLPMDPRWETTGEDGAPIPGPERPAWKTLETGEALRDVTMRIRRADATPTWISVNTVPLR